MGADSCELPSRPTSLCFFRFQPIPFFLDKWIPDLLRTESAEILHLVACFPTEIRREEVKQSDQVKVAPRSKNEREQFTNPIAVCATVKETSPVNLRKRLLDYRGHRLFRNAEALRHEMTKRIGHLYLPQSQSLRLGLIGFSSSCATLPTRPTECSRYSRFRNVSRRSRAIRCVYGLLWLRSRAAFPVDQTFLAVACQ